MHGLAAGSSVGGSVPPPVAVLAIMSVTAPAVDSPAWRHVLQPEQILENPDASSGVDRDALGSTAPCTTHSPCAGTWKMGHNVLPREGEEGQHWNQ